MKRKLPKDSYVNALFKSYSTRVSKSELACIIEEKIGVLVSRDTVYRRQRKLRLL